MKVTIANVARRLGSGSVLRGRIPLSRGRDISIGTDMISSVISLQKARPWYHCADEGSNNAIDNAVYLNDLFAPGKTVALFGVPAPFTGTCTHEHYPAYQELAEEILQAGCDELVCYSVSDPYALNGWQTILGNDLTKIRFLADPDASFAKAYGVERVYESCSLGLRSVRFSMIVQDGIVCAFRIVEDAAADAKELLNELRDMKENSEGSEIVR